MSDVDEYARDVFQSAKTFLFRAQTAQDDRAKQAYLRASILSATCFLECQVNHLCDHFSHRREFTLHERALLMERDVRLSDGKFKLGNERFYRVEDRILFLLGKFCADFDKTSHDWWAQYKIAVNTRNSIAHPRETVVLIYAEVESSLKGILRLVDFLLRKIFGKGLPYILNDINPRHEY